MAKGPKPVYAVISSTEKLNEKNNKVVTYTVRTMYDGIIEINLPKGSDFTVKTIKAQMCSYNDSRQTHRTVARVIKEYIQNRE